MKAFKTIFGSGCKQHFFVNQPFQLCGFYENEMIVFVF